VDRKNLKNDVEFIGCGIRVTSDGVGGTFQFGFCQAADSAGVQITSFTEDAGLLETLRSISDFAYIIFNWDEHEECTRIGISTQSFYLPDFTIKGKN